MVVCSATLEAAEAGLRGNARIVRSRGAATLLGGDVVQEAPPTLTAKQRIDTAGVPLSEKAAYAERQSSSEVVHRFGDWFERSHLCYERQQAKHVESLRLPHIIDDLLRPNANESTSKITGRERLAIIKRTLDSFAGIERSETQREFHDMMICACAMLIFKDDLDEELDDLLQEYGITELQAEAMFITPRRWGKTYSVAMFVVAIALGIEAVEKPFEISIFSTGPARVAEVVGAHLLVHLQDRRHEGHDPQAHRRDDLAPGAAWRRRHSQDLVVSVESEGECRCVRGGVRSRRTGRVVNEVRERGE